jgi:hypothetical protein
MNKLRLCAFAFLFGLFAAPAMAQDITVAVAGPVTGGQATFGRQMKNGADQAIADLNAAGGVLGPCRRRSARSPGRRRFDYAAAGGALLPAVSQRLSSRRRSREMAGFILGHRAPGSAADDGLIGNETVVVTAREKVHTPHRQALTEGGRARSGNPRDLL